MQKLIIVGAGGCGRDVLHWAVDCTAAGADWQPLGFIDDNPQALSGLKCTHPLLGSITDWQPQEDQLFICAIADPALRRSIVSLLNDKGAHFTSLIHPTVRVVATATLGQGVILSPYVTVSDNAVVGDFVFVNLHSALGHDSHTGDYTTICSFCDVTGGVQLGPGVYLGSRVTVVPGVSIGEQAFLCAGSVVMNNIAPGVKVLGNPARVFSI